MPAPLTIPLVDLAPYLDPNASPAARQATASAIHSACSKVGFFYLKGHGVPREKMDEVLRLARDFFDRPKEEKEEISIAKMDLARGYQRTGENVTLSKPDWHEGLDLYAPSPFPPTVPSDRPLPPLSGTNQFPAQPAELKQVLEEWIETLKDVGEVLMRATADGLGMDESEKEDLVKSTKDSFWVLRCIGYPQLPAAHDGVSCGAHKDYGAWTLLHTDSTRGALQVFLHERDPATGKVLGNGQWINADPVEDAFVVNIGEMWEIWSNDLYKATLHRVIHHGANYRVSVPFFYEPSFDAWIEPLPAALRLQAKEGGRGSEGKRKEPVRYGDFLLKKVGGNFAVKDDGSVSKGRY